MRILIDLDSTILNMLEPWIEVYNARHGDTLKIEDVKDFDIHKFTKDGSPAIYDIIKEPYWYHAGNRKPFKGAIKAVEMLNEVHDVYIATASPSGIGSQEKTEWVATHLPFLTKKQLIIGHPKHLIKGDCLIDDSPQNAERFREENPDAIIIGIQFPYNNDCKAFNFVASSYKDPERAWYTIVSHLINYKVGKKDIGTTGVSEI